MEVRIYKKAYSTKTRTNYRKRGSIKQRSQSTKKNRHLARRWRHIPSTSDRCFEHLLRGNIVESILSWNDRHTCRHICASHVSVGAIVDTLFMSTHLIHVMLQCVDMNKTILYMKTHRIGVLSIFYVVIFSKVFWAGMIAIETMKYSWLACDLIKKLSSKIRILQNLIHYYFQDCYALSIHAKFWVKTRFLSGAMNVGVSWQPKPCVTLWAD